MKSKFINKMISAIIFVSFIFQLGMPAAYAGEPPASAVAEVTKEGTVTYTDTLQGAFDLIGSGTGTIKVLEDIDLGATTNITQTTGTVTLDLNGKTISAALTDQSKLGVVRIDYNANLTITDSGENGEIRNVSEGLIVPAVATSGTLSMNDGKLYAEGTNGIGGTAVSVYRGTVTMTGNACLEGIQFAIQTTGGTINIQGGDLIGNYGIYCGNNGNLNMTGGLIQGKDRSIACNGKNNITIDGGILIGTAFDNNDEAATGSILFNSGAIFGDTKEGDNYYSSTSWTDMTSLTGWQAKGSAVLPIDAEIPSAKTFTVPKDATLTIEDGATLTNNGTLLLNGTLNGTGTLAGSGDFKTTRFTADDIQDIPDQPYTGSAVEPEVTIVRMGKEFTVDATSYTKTYENNINAGTAKVIFTNTADSNDKIEKTFKIVSAVAEVTKQGTVTYLETLQGAFDLIGSGTGTIKVLQDIDLGSATNITQSTGTVTLDLNGKTISAALTDQSKLGLFLINFNANLTITDSGEKGEIRNVASDDFPLPVIRTYGTLFINDGKLYAEDSGVTYAVGIAVIVSAGTATITGNACLEGKQDALDTTGGTVNIQGGHFIGDDGIWCTLNGSLNMTGGLIQGTHSSILSNGVNNIAIDGGVLIGTVWDNNDAAATGSIIFNNGAIFGDTKEGDNYYNPDAWTDMTSLTGWQIKGSAVLPIDAEIPSGKTFTVPKDATLTILDEATLTNNGTLLLNGTLNGTGTIAGSGDFKANVFTAKVLTTNVFTADDIQDIPDQTYTGSAVLPEVTFNAKALMGKEFIADASSYAKSYENNINAGTAKVIFTNTADANDKLEKSFKIVQSGTTFDGGMKAYNGTTETNSFTYGDTITVKVTPKATGTAPAVNSLKLRSFSAPTANQMALFAGTTQITEPVNADNNGIYTITYNTKEKGLAIGDNTITAKYTGNSNMADYSENITVTLHKKVITAAVVNDSDASASKEYDGTNSFMGVALNSLTGVESGDTVKATAEGTVTDSNVGTDKAFTASGIVLEGDDKDYYRLSIDEAVISGKVAITQATAAGVDQELQVVKDLAKEYTFDLSKLLPDLSESKRFGEIAYTVEAVSNTDNVLAQNPADSDIQDGKITIKVAKVPAKDKTASIQIKVASDNYKAFTADLSLKTVDKIPLNMEAEFTGGTYNGKECAYTGTPTFKNGEKPVSGITYTAKYAGRDDTSYTESETAPINAGKYNLILTVSGESTNTYGGTTTIDFEIKKKQIVAKPNDVSIKSNASFPQYSWSVETGISGEIISATNGERIAMEAQENGTKLPAVKTGTFDIVFTTAPTFQLSGDIEKNYNIQIGKGKLTVIKHNSGGNSSSGKNSSSGSHKGNTSTDTSTKNTDTITQGKISFSDIANHWAKDDIEFVTEKGLFSGTGNGNFSPNMSMTRGMFVTVLGRLANADVSSYTNSNFTDVKANAYYMPYIQWAGEKGIANGVSGTGFAPDQSITREQMAVIMVSYAKSIGFELPQVNKENTFTDNGEISSYAKEAVKQMQIAGVLAGKDGNKFDPKGTATRAEVSAVLKRFAELVQKK